MVCDRQVTAAVGALAVAAALTGCGGVKHDSGPAIVSAQTSSPAVAAPATTEDPATPGSGVSNGKTYSVTVRSVDGGTPDGMRQWKVAASELSGGDSAVVEAFNNASQASAHQQIEAAQTDLHEGFSWTLEGNSDVTFRKIAIGQVITGNAYTPNTAHPASFVNTIVVDSRTAKPIMLVDLFTNQQAGLNRISEQIRVVEPTIPDQPGIEPKAENFASWIPTTKGMEIHFADYQIGAHGLFVVTVPWSALTDVLATNMQALTQG